MDWHAFIFRFARTKDAARLAATCVGMHEAKAKHVDHVVVTRSNSRKISAVLQTPKRLSVEVNCYNNQRLAFSDEIVGVLNAIKTSRGIVALKARGVTFGGGYAWPHSLKSVCLEVDIARLAFTSSQHQLQAIESLVTDPAMAACQVELTLHGANPAIWNVLPRAINLVKLTKCIDSLEDIGALARLFDERGAAFELLPACLQALDLTVDATILDDASFDALASILESYKQHLTLIVKTFSIIIAPGIFFLRTVKSLVLQSIYTFDSPQYPVPVKPEGLLRDIEHLEIHGQGQLAETLWSINLASLPNLHHVTLTNCWMLDMSHLANVRTLEIVYTNTHYNSTLLSIDSSRIPQSLTMVKLRFLEREALVIDVTFTSNLPASVEKMAVEQEVGSQGVVKQAVFLKSEFPKGPGFRVFWRGAIDDDVVLLRKR